MFKRLLGFARKSATARSAAIALSVAVVVGSGVGLGFQIAKSDPVPVVTVMPSPIPEPVVLKPSELSIGQRNYFQSVVKAFAKYIQAGDFASARAVLASANVGGPDGCRFGYAGMMYLPGDDVSLDALGAELMAAREAIAKYGPFLTKEFDVPAPPLVVPSYKGKYPNGKAYLRIVEVRGHFIVGMQCTVEPEATVIP